jgi:2-C-methyl-D-erythritol 4-phosphate cytidylyltransferase/2-C-methyl-D-erythritol 2,4-cyclodiphosphate synthase
MANSENKGKAAAIIAAGGSSSRMNGADKLFAEIDGVPVIMRAVLAFERAESIDEIIIASNSEAKIKKLCKEYSITKLKTVVNGGSDRCESVLNAVKQVSADINIIAVHDGARPFITSELINKITCLAEEKGAVIPAVRVKDTVKIVQNGAIISTPGRDELYLAQTPQAFLLSKYLEAVHKSSGLTVTDDAMLFENAGFEVFITEGNYKNKKITTPEDLNNVQCTMNNEQLRIGIGYDVHKFAKERELILCGVEIPHEEGLLGHSDADAAVHALIDALLGALALGDIGKHFPDTDPQYKGISSMELLSRVNALINEHGYKPSNIDITIIADRPKLAPYIMQMQENIAGACKVPLGAVSVKATTEEGLGLAGKGIGANAVCLLKSITVT